MRTVKKTEVDKVYKRILNRLDGKGNVKDIDLYISKGCPTDFKFITSINKKDYKIIRKYIPNVLMDDVGQYLIGITFGGDKIGSLIIEKLKTGEIYIY